MVIIPQKLQDALNNNNLIIFIGAGCSIPLNYPSWKSLIIKILQELDNNYGSVSSTNFKNILNAVKNDSIDLFSALNKIEKDLDNGTLYKVKSKEYINALFKDLKNRLPIDSKVHHKIWEISQKIITTNYDKNLEQYCPAGINPICFDNTNSFQVLKSESQNSKFLFNIHGTFENPNSIILFESDYIELYKEGNPNQNTFTSFFKGKTLLFIGFSLSDPFINKLFSNIKKIYDDYTIAEHFVLTTKNEDFTKYDIKSINIGDWDKGLHNFLESLERTKSKNDILEKENDINNIIKILNQKTEDLINNPSDKDSQKEYRNLEIKVRNLLFDKINFLQEVNTSFRKNDLEILFDRIYSSEKLESQIIEQIQNVRTNTNLYKWHDRSVIVSALSCSIIHFNKADEKKIFLLIDFVNDNEEKVWQKALVSLIISLNHLGNKWLRFQSLKDKIQSLNENLKIQEACSVIIKLFTIGLNNLYMIDEKLFNNPYFNDNPYRYFLPFHSEENPAFDLVYDNYEGDNIEDYIFKIKEIPIPDQLKYLIVSESNPEPKEKKKDSLTDEITYILNLNSFFYPYSVLTQEIISFYKFFPKYKHEEKLKYQLKLTETPLKNYLLSAKEKFSSLGYYFMRERNWTQAIVNFKEALTFDKNNISILLNLATSYNLNKDYEKEFATRKEIRNLDENNEQNLLEIAYYYLNIKSDYKKSLEISNKLIEINPKQEVYYNISGINYFNLDNCELALKNFSKSIEINSEEALVYQYRSKVNSEMFKFDEALIDINEAINLEPNKSSHFEKRADIYYQLNQYEKSINDLDISIKLSKNNLENYLNKATNYLCMSLFDLAYENIIKAENLDSDKADVYNIYSNYFRLQNKFNKAFEYIEKAEKANSSYKFTGTKAAIYSSKNDDNNFFKYFEQAINEGAEARLLFPDVKNKYKNNPTFLKILEKYNQRIE